MADENRKIDMIFRDRLAGHSEAPSPLAWEKIQGRLEHNSKARFKPWMRTAASLLLIVGAPGLYYLSLERQGKPGTLAQEATIPDTELKETPGGEFPQIHIPVIQTPDSEPVAKPAPIQIRPIKEATSSGKLVAVQSDVPAQESVPQMAVELPDLPPLDTELAVAEGGLSGEQIEEVAYKVTIISNGLKQRREKENLVEEIENKIDRLGGLLNKVDQSLAELQDAKNGLFASLAGKKENSHVESN